MGMNRLNEAQRSGDLPTPVTKTKPVFKRLAPLWTRWRQDFGFRTLTNAHLALAATTLFALYNGYVGLTTLAVWNGSICFYYLLLSVTRGYILLIERPQADLPPEQRQRVGSKACVASACALLLLNLTLIAPISLMSQLKRPVGISFVPAIASAVYATWKIGASTFNFRVSRKSEDMLVRMLRTINLIDALVSILTLQNTLIMVNSGSDASDMIALATVSSAIVFMIIIAISTSAFLDRPDRLQRVRGSIY